MGSPDESLLLRLKSANRPPSQTLLGPGVAAAAPTPSSPVLVRLDPMEVANLEGMGVGIAHYQLMWVERGNGKGEEEEETGNEIGVNGVMNGFNGWGWG